LRRPNDRFRIVVFTTIAKRATLERTDDFIPDEVIARTWMSAPTLNARRVEWPMTVWTWTCLRYPLRLRSICGCAEARSHSAFGCTSIPWRSTVGDMAKRKSGLSSLRSNLYKTQRAIGDLQALEKSPAALAKRRVRRAVTRDAFQGLGSAPTIAGAAVASRGSHSARGSKKAPPQALTASAGASLTEWTSALSAIPIADRIPTSEFLTDLNRTNTGAECTADDYEHDTVIANLCTVIIAWGVSEIDPETWEGLLTASPQVWRDVRSEIVSTAEVLWTNRAIELAAFFNALVVTLDGERLNALG
jgi:hypothetical protein